MKKIISISLLALFCTLTITSCTEEKVVPAVKTDNGGGGIMDGKI